MRVFAEGVPKAGHEERVRQPIARFFTSLVGDVEVECEASVLGGRCDIVLPKARLVVETKAPNAPCHPTHGMSETQFDQLERYIAALRQGDPQMSLPGIGDAPVEGPWIGILTNGQVWWAWMWPDSDTGATPIDEMHRVSYSAEIDELLKRWAKREGGKPWIPADPSEAFRPLRDELNSLYDGAGHNRSLKVQQSVWADLIRGSGLSVPEGRAARLYVDHLFLLSLSRAVVNLFQQTKKTPDELMRDSYGSWLDSSQQGREWLDKLSRKVDSYNWRMRPTDVLRTLYQSIIPKADRKLYGEYYTPDWLAGMIVEEMLDDAWLDSAIHAAYEKGAPPKGIGVLDPTCGSGTFLFHAARRIVEAIPRHLDIPLAERSLVALRLVSGIDIHPVAVEMARATLLRALPCPAAEPSIHQGDALLIQRQGDEQQQNLSFVDQGALFAYPPDSPDNIFVIPYSLVESEDMALRIQLLVDSARSPTAKCPEMVTDGIKGEDRSALKDAHETLRRIIKKHANGVWTWYIRNQLAPYALSRRKVDRIVANPPWLRFSEIQEPRRKAEIQALAEKLSLTSPGNTKTGGDIAGLFVAATKQRYLAKAGRAAYVLNAAAVGAKNWNAFRDAGHAKGLLDLTESHLDGEVLKAKPFHGAQSCVVGLRIDTPNRLVLVDASQRLAPGMAWSVARQLVRRIPAQPPIPTEAESPYKQSARNGATIFPAVLVRIDPDHPDLTLQPTRAKAPWKYQPVFSIKDIPGEWRHKYLESQNLAPFRVVTPLSCAIIPMEGSRLLTDQEARGRSRTWRELAEAYQQYRSIGANTPKDLIARINYGGGWLAQFPTRTSVVYNGSGQVLRAAVTNLPIEHKLYRVPMESEDAAHYLCAMLNAPSLAPLYKYARDSDRHFDKTPFSKIPIPRYRPGTHRYRRLAELARMAAEGGGRNASLTRSEVWPRRSF